MELADYLKSINELYKSGNATEHTYRHLVIELFKDIPKISVLNEPSRQKCGAPDYIVSKGNIPLGYIEAKDIGDSDLEGKSKNREQFERYKSSLNNLIITDYLRFFRYQNGELVQQIAIGDYNPKVKPGKITARPENFSSFEAMLKDFCSYMGQTITSPKELAYMMAGKARLLADIIGKALSDKEGKEHGSEDSQDNDHTLQDQLKAFKEILIHDISLKEFADMYAQTITYGMFAARLNDSSMDNFTRQEAAELIPKSNPFLRKLFGYISGPDIDDRIKWVVDDLANVYLASNVREILKNFGRSTQTEDPIIHFYETFLSEYDPKLRKSRGVWYTPKPVVEFIVGAVDEVLKTEFGLGLGLADTSKTTVKIGGHDQAKEQQHEEVHRVQILDPAAGTGTFLTEVVHKIHERFKGQEGMWGNYVKEHLLPRLNGFEILMASYAMAHLQLSEFLADTGYRADNAKERIRVFLTNSMEEHHPDTGTLFASWLSDEANAANYIKRDTPVMCVLGNPPYSGESANQGEWIMKLMEDYKKEPGGKTKLDERNSKDVNNDYVKFIRYGQYFIEKNGSGVLAFINPHGYLDNLTFRGMRWHLLKTYDKIYTIDLHGHAEKKEVAPDGGKDENVFDIKEGVSINVFIKTGKKKPNELGQVYHYDLYGKREDKYHFLSTHTLGTIDFNEIPNQPPMYFMVQKDFALEKKYVKGFSVVDLFKVNNVGIVTSRDSFVIADDKKNLKQRIEDFFNFDKATLQNQYNLKENSSWKIEEVREKAKSFRENDIKKVSYRPFDNKYIYYNNNFIERSRTDVMQHFLKGENVGLVIARQCVGDWKYIFCTRLINEYNLTGTAGRFGSGNTFPLYLYPEDDSMDTGRHPNLNADIVGELAKSLGLTFVPEKGKDQNTFAPIDILDYIYAVLHSPRYRNTYQEFLKIDFPRIPFPKISTFWELVKLGGELRRIHLLESSELESFITSYPVSGNNTVVKPEFIKGKVYINDTQYFDKVPETVWSFYIGGYQPAQKWLKDRKGNTLSFDDITHYQKIIVALRKTNKIMQEINTYKLG